MYMKKHRTESKDWRNFKSVRTLFVTWTHVTTLHPYYMRMHSFSANQKRVMFFRHIITANTSWEWMLMHSDISVHPFAPHNHLVLSSVPYKYSDPNQTFQNHRQVPEKWLWRLWCSSESVRLQPGLDKYTQMESLSPEKKDNKEMDTNKSRSR